MVTYSCKAVHSNITIGQTPLVIHPLYLYCHSILICCILNTMCKDNRQNPFTGSYFFLYNRSYRHFFDVVSKSSSSSFYLILTAFGTSTALCLVVELLSPASPVLLTTLGLDVPFLVDCGLVPFFWSWGLDELVTPLRASRGLLEVFILGCCRDSIGFKGLRPKSPQ